jgi:hypothetical protein
MEVSAEGRTCVRSWTAGRSDWRPGTPGRSGNTPAPHSAHTTHTHTHTHTHTRTRTHTHTHTHTHTRTPTHPQTRTHTPIHTHTHIHARTTSEAPGGCLDSKLGDGRGYCSKKSDGNVARRNALGTSCAWHGISYHPNTARTCPRDLTISMDMCRLCDTCLPSSPIAARLPVAACTHAWTHETPMCVCVCVCVYVCAMQASHHHTHTHARPCAKLTHIVGGATAAHRSPGQAPPSCPASTPPPSRSPPARRVGRAQQADA